MAGPTTRVNLFQTATNAAAALLSGSLAMEVEEDTDVSDILVPFRALRDAIVEDLELVMHESAKADTVRAEAAIADPGDVVLTSSFKKHAGKTLAQVWEENPGYVSWIAEKAKSTNQDGSAKLEILAARKFLVGKEKEE
jgi:nickel-dependent lactate racemase